jgi:hypothetical protein
MYVTQILYTELFALGLSVLCYVLITRFMFYYSSYVCFNCFVRFVLYFVCSVFLYCFVYFLLMYKFLSICVQVCGPQPPGGNSTVVK